MVLDNGLFAILFAEDADGDGDLEMDETVDEENTQDQDFIDDISNVSFSDDPSFYRGVDNSIETAASIVDKNHIKNLNLTADDYREWLINPDAQVENYTPFSLKFLNMTILKMKRLE